MATPSTSQKRPQSLLSLGGSAQRPVVSLDAWESSVPLKENQIQSINAWKSQCDQKPLPLKFEEDQQPSTSRPGTPLRSLKQREGPIRPSSRPGTPMTNLPANARGKHPLHPVNPITTPQQFYDWFALIERSIQHSQEAHFRSHLSQLTQHLDKCRTLSGQLDNVDDQVLHMLEAWHGVEEGGRSLQEASEKLLEEKDRLVDVTGAISARLAYFQELERATRMLNHPGDDIVLQTDFLIMVERVDICLAYLQQHREYKEADIYILRFQQCLIRAMSLIRIFFTTSVRNLSADIERQKAEKAMSTMSEDYLLYQKFSSLATQVSPLLTEMERRTLAYPADLQSLLDECHTVYFTVRKALLAARIASEIKGLDPAHSELVELTRAGCGYLRQLCEDEFALYRQFFNSGEDKLYHYLETLCDFLYDDLRPRILHEQRISILCEVCTVLQALMVLGNDILETGSDDESVVPETPQEDSSKGLQTLQIGGLLQMILQDAQTRLVFKAQAIIQSEIRLHAPSEDEIRYPEILIEYRKLVSSRTNEYNSQTPPDSPSIRIQKTWYASVQKTAWIISLLREYIKPEIFRDIAQEAISFCRESLEVACQKIAAKNEQYGRIDAKLFLIRHLLVLKELVSDANLVNSENEIQAIQPGSSDGFFGIPLFRPVALLGSLAYLGVPRLLSGAETPLNVDQELKTVCEMLISDCVTAATKPIRLFMERSTAYLEGFASTSLNEKPSTTAQESTTPKQALEADQEFRASCEREVKLWASRVQLFLDDNRTVSALSSPLERQIVEEYALFRGLLAGRYGHELLEQTYTEHGLLTALRQWDGSS